MVCYFWYVNLEIVMKENEILPMVTAATLQLDALRAVLYQCKESKDDKNLNERACVLYQAFLSSLLNVVGMSSEEFLQIHGNLKKWEEDGIEIARHKSYVKMINEELGKIWDNPIPHPEWTDEAIAKYLIHALPSLGVFLHELSFPSERRGGIRVCFAKEVASGLSEGKKYLEKYR